MSGGPSSSLPLRELWLPLARLLLSTDVRSFGSSDRVVTPFTGANLTNAVTLVKQRGCPLSLLPFFFSIPPF